MTASDRSRDQAPTDDEIEAAALSWCQAKPGWPGETMTYIKLQRMNARAALVAAGGPSRVQREQIIDVLEDVGPMIDWTLMGAERFEDRVRSLLSDLREDE